MYSSGIAPGSSMKPTPGIAKVHFINVIKTKPHRETILDYLFEKGIRDGSGVNYFHKGIMKREPVNCKPKIRDILRAPSI